MPSIQQIRTALSREVEDSGRVRDTDLTKEKRWPVTVGEVTSLTPPTVELLNGQQARIRWKLTSVTTPRMGDLVLLVRLARVVIAVGIVEAI